jgi:AcrR family transcriptional regulator
MREAALRLISERGYEATSTDDIARAAGVSPRTFFNYFATKDACVLLPEEFLPDLMVAAVHARPPGEDPAASAAAAIMDSFLQLSRMIGASAGELMQAQLRVILTEPELRRITLERRMILEDAAWEALQRRGVSGQDLGARAALTTAISLAFLGLISWALGDDDEPLLVVMARCLLAAPHPTRLAAGVRVVPLDQ